MTNSKNPRFQEALDSNAQVLIVDDLPSTRLILRDMLEQIGFKNICEAADGKDALKKLQQTPTQLVLCDQKMERMTGLEFLNVIRKEPTLKGVPFIVISAHQERHLIDGAQHLGASAYIPKPVDFEALKASVESLLPGKVV